MVRPSGPELTVPTYADKSPRLGEWSPPLSSIAWELVKGEAPYCQDLVAFECATSHMFDGVDMR